MLTFKQRDVLIYLKAYLAENEGVSPSYAEIAAATNHSSKSVVMYTLRRLEERGFIRRLPYRTRAIQVVGEPIWQSDTAPPRYAAFKFDDSTKQLVRVNE